MPSIQNLKKQLRGIRSTQKLTKAMWSVSAAKFSRLHACYARCAEYGRRCRQSFDSYRDGFLAAAPAPNGEAPPLYVVMAGNRGLCGSFNAELLKFAQTELAERDEYLLIACGKKAIAFFRRRNIPLEGEYVLSDEPTMEQCAALLEQILHLRRSGRVSGVFVISPRYDNMMVHTPRVSQLFPSSADGGQERQEAPALCVPDRQTLIDRTAPAVFRAMLYELMLATALGAQAATLMTMRMAYKSATEYCAQLEGQISRMRQSAVTADVIETSSGEQATM